MPILREMAQLLPKWGRMALRYMSPPLRVNVRIFTARVLSETPPLQELSRHLSDDPAIHHSARRNAWETVTRQQYWRLAGRNGHSHQYG